MTENDPPMAAAASNGAGTGGNGGMTDGTMARGIPYYEKLRRELRDTIQRKRLLDKNLSLLEESIYRFEQSYLEETGAGNIIKGFDNYIKGAAGTSSLSATGSGLGSSFGAGGGGPNTRKRGQVSDVDRVFSRSSVGFMRDSTPSSVTTTPSHAPTPTYSGPGGSQKDSNKDKDPVSATNSTKGAGNKKTNRKSTGAGGGAPNRNNDDDDDDGDSGATKQPTKRLKITYSRGAD